MERLGADDVQQILDGEPQASKGADVGGEGIALDPARLTFIVVDGAGTEVAHLEALPSWTGLETMLAINGAIPCVFAGKDSDHFELEASCSALHI
eukprot:6465988-Amphidinium_carterae.1